MKTIFSILLATITCNCFAQKEKPGITIAADKMNVFYIGVDNPISIAPGRTWKNTEVQIEGGILNGTGSSRVVRVDQPGIITLSVIHQNDTSRFSFRTKELPDPVFKIGSGKKRMTTPEFKAQQYCRADLENFDFDLRIPVVSANVYAFIPLEGKENKVLMGKINGNSLAEINWMTTQLCPGSSVVFEHIIVRFPNDELREISPATYSLF